jgi:hypothetical protein
MSLRKRNDWSNLIICNYPINRLPRPIVLVMTVLLCYRKQETRDSSNNQWATTNALLSLWGGTTWQSHVRIRTQQCAVCSIHNTNKNHQLTYYNFSSNSKGMKRLSVDRLKKFHKLITNHQPRHTFRFCRNSIFMEWLVSKECNGLDTIMQ